MNNIVRKAVKVPAQPRGQCVWEDWGRGNRDEVREVREGLELADSCGTL